MYFSCDKSSRSKCDLLLKNIIFLKKIAKTSALIINIWQIQKNLQVNHETGVIDLIIGSISSCMVMIYCNTGRIEYKAFLVRQ